MIKLDEPTSLGVIGALTLPVIGSGSGGVRQAVRHREPVDLRRASGLDGPVHGRDDREEYTPNKEIHLVRNPNWKASDADFRPAYLDDINIQEGFADTVSAGKKMLDGQRRGQR